MNLCNRPLVEKCCFRRKVSKAGVKSCRSLAVYLKFGRNKVVALTVPRWANLRGQARLFLPSFINTTSVTSWVGLWPMAHDRGNWEGKNNTDYLLSPLHKSLSETYIVPGSVYRAFLACNLPTRNAFLRIFNPRETSPPSSTIKNKLISLRT